jgi:hypothetical protein
MAKAHLHLEKRIDLKSALPAEETQAAIAALLTSSAGTISLEVWLSGTPGG